MEIKPHELIPALENAEVTVRIGSTHRFELPIGERALLAALTLVIRPKTVYEIGTYTGYTTRLFADSLTTEGHVHTLDLPPGENSFNPKHHEFVGRAFRNDPAYSTRITQHWGDSRTFDFSPWEHSVDLVYVDASHEYEDVIRDSKTAMSLVAPGGLIVWDDYHYRYSGVVKALNELSRQIELRNFFRTRLVVHMAKP